MPLIGVILLAVMLIAGIIAMINSIPLSIRTIYSYSKYSLGISPRGDADLTPQVIAKVKKGSPVPLDRIVLVRTSGAQVRSIVGKWPFVVIGMSNVDMKYALDRLSVKSLSGRLPHKGQPEMVVSAPVARNLKLKLGSTVIGPDKQDSYSPFEVKVVGIANTDQWLMFNDIEYQRLNHFPPIESIMVYAKNLADQSKLDHWAEKAFKGQRTQIYPFHVLERQTAENFDTLYKILDVVIGTLVLVITVMMGMLINIYLSQRIVEFGLLQAIGYTKNRLLRRVLVESAIVVALGWLCGIGAGYLLLSIVGKTLMEPHAYPLSTLDRLAITYTVPVPIAILMVAVLTVWLRFRKFDPVAVVERRLV